MQQSSFAYKKLDWFNVWCSQTRQRIAPAMSSTTQLNAQTHFNTKKVGTDRWSESSLGLVSKDSPQSPDHSFNRCTTPRFAKPLGRTVRRWLQECWFAGKSLASSWGRKVMLSMFGESQQHFSPFLETKTRQPNYCQMVHCSFEVIQQSHFWWCFCVLLHKNSAWWSVCNAFLGTGVNKTLNSKCPTL